MWFIDTQMIDRLELNAWMGEVKETIIAKHAARMGLVRFSYLSSDSQVDTPALLDESNR